MDCPNLFQQTARLMKAPFDRKPAPSQREILLDECRLCFAAAAGCSAIGILAMSYHSWWGRSTPLVALLVVGGFYAVMGVGRLVKYLLTPDGGQQRDEPGH
ncbi:MAG: hypothetical protein Q8K78_01090 [Planctomycetaceae bacterium]|nr:hypothetical protein [Planctomycetaceae bacterium]